ncbi:MAG: PQQ-dependent sugar dehydrogenase [Kiloniellales bacterium]
MPRFAVAAAAVLALTLAAPAGAETFESQAGPIEVATVAEGLVHPWGLAFLPDGRMLVTERPGRLRIVAPDGSLSEPLAGLPEVHVGGQAGLLDVALDPGFAENRTIYFSFAEPGEGGAGTAVARATLMPGALADVEVIFRQLPKLGGNNHWGSRLVFAPDGTLFVTTGDRRQEERAQNLEMHQGKVIRIHPDGRIPDDNPFVGRPDAKPEIWSYGHRNIQGATRHPETGALWIVDHGARGGDEVNVPEAGRNYGWPVITYGRDYTYLPIGEGTHKEGMEQPLYYWDPSIAPSGLAFYTGDRMPEWKGDLFVGALAGRLLARLELDGKRVVGEERLLTDLGERIRAVVDGPDGYLYLLTDSDEGRILRLGPA